MSLQEDRLRRLSRLFLIYHLLEMTGPEGRLSRRDLEAACQCAPKTVQRDLDFLREAGAEIVYRKRGYHLERPLPCLGVELQLHDIAALALLQSALGSSTALPGGAAARAAFRKLTARLPARLRDELTTLPEVLAIGDSARRDYSTSPLSELVAAARERRTVCMLYYSIGRDEYAHRRVDPYQLTLRGGFLHLAAFCHQRREVRLFALDNIRALTVTTDRFVVPADFSLARYLEGVVGGLRGELTAIAVRFEPAVARWARRQRWDFPHEMTPQPDGSLLLRARVSGLDAIAKELLRWGAHVEALEPPELRRMLHCEALAIAEKYRCEISAGSAR